MKFRAAVIVSGLLHVTLFALVMTAPPRAQAKAGTYYVDLIRLSNGPGGGPRGGARGRGGLKAPAIPTGRMRDLTVEKKPASTLRYPDAKSRREAEEKQVTVVRKPDPQNPRAGVGGDGATPGLLTGISSDGDGYGDGDGSGGIGNGFPYAYYIDNLKNRISQSWYNSLVSPGLTGRFVTAVRFRIWRDGRVSDVTLETESGVPSLDLSARRAVENASPFAPLPDGFPGSFLIVHFEFEWKK